MIDNTPWFWHFNSQNLKPSGFRERHEGFIDVFEAFKGTLLKKKLFKNDVIGFPKDEYCFIDDVWFSGHIIKNGFNILISNYNLEIKYIQNEVDDLSENIDVRNNRMKDVATYFHKSYGIWSLDPIC